MSLYSQEKTGKGYENREKPEKLMNGEVERIFLLQGCHLFFINDKGEKVKKIIILIAILLALFFLTVISNPGQEFGATQGVVMGARMAAPFLVSR